jgi:hypothetical protein
MSTRCGSHPAPASGCCSLDSVAELERVTFLVSTDRKQHEKVLEGLRAADAADEVVAFRDEEEE